MRIATFMIAGIATVAISTASSAQQVPTDEQRAAMFKAADKNADGKLSREEYLAMLPDEAKGFADQLFAARDTNQDGFIDAQESAKPLNLGG